MRLFRKRYRPPTPTGHVIDMTKVSWGFNIEFSQWMDETNKILRVTVWMPRRPSVGDIIKYRSNRHIVSGLVTEVQPAPGVWDMSFVNMQVVDYEENK